MDALERAITMCRRAVFFALAALCVVSNIHRLWLGVDGAVLYYAAAVIFWREARRND